MVVSCRSTECSSNVRHICTGVSFILVSSRWVSERVSDLRRVSEHPLPAICQDSPVKESVWSHLQMYHGFLGVETPSPHFSAFGRFFSLWKGAKISCMCRRHILGCLPSLQGKTSPLFTEHWALTNGAEPLDLWLYKTPLLPTAATVMGLRLTTVPSKVIRYLFQRCQR